MATKENPVERPGVLRRELLEAQFAIYKRIVQKKHGVAVSLTDELSKELTDDELLAYVDALRDMAHLPPS